MTSFTLDRSIDSETSITFERFIIQHKVDVSVSTATKKDQVIIGAFLVIGVPLLILGAIGLLSHGRHTHLHLAIPKGGCISLLAVGGVMTIGGSAMTIAMMKRHFDFKKEVFSVHTPASILHMIEAPLMNINQTDPIYNLERPKGSQKIGYCNLTIDKAPGRLLFMNMYVYKSRNPPKDGLI